MSFADGDIVRTIINPNAIFIYRGCYQNRAKLESITEDGRQNLAPRFMVDRDKVFKMENDQPKKAIPCAPVPPLYGSQAVKGDPSNLHVAGAKDDSVKVMIDLILDDMPRALLAVAAVATFGAKKYTRGGWLSVPNGIQRYRAALQRHMLNETIDEGGRDPETNLHHAAHEAWNALARLELLCREEEQIDKIGG